MFRLKQNQPFWPIVLLLSLVVNFALAQSHKAQTTVVLSLDGFRWDYPQKGNTPNLNRIAANGVRAVSLVPSFPSKTFPNHYTIATGLYPDHHGLVNNAFYDTVAKRSFAIGLKDARFDPLFYLGEPIWITAQRQGLKTASYFWVGSDVAINGRHPDYWKMYDEEVSFEQRIDTVIYWLSLPQKMRPSLIMTYYHEPDGVGHDFGPDDTVTLRMVHYLDSLTGVFYDKIRRLPEGDSINFIVLSDHGMGAISSERNVALNDYLPETWPVKIEGGNPNFNIYANGSWVDSVYMKLKMVEGIEVWKPIEVPAELNYGSNYKVGNIIVIADSAWSVTRTKPSKEYSGGTHGYDIRNTDIHAIFYADGPAFKSDFVHPSFQNIHIYSLLAYLLGITPAKTDGDLEHVINLLNISK